MRILVFGLAFIGVTFSVFPSGAAVHKLILFCVLTILLFAQHSPRYCNESFGIIAPYFLYIIFCALSAYWYSGSLSYVASSLFTLILGLLFYFYFAASSLHIHKPQNIKKFVIIIISLQVLFALLKLVIHGIDEKYLIGTMSHTAGQLGFLFPAIAIPVACYFTAEKNKKWMWFLITALAAFGIINEKRSIVFLLPVIIYASLKINSLDKTPNYHQRTFQSVAMLIVAISVIYLGAYFIPSLNVDETYGGAVNFIYLFEYAVDYLVMDYEDSLQGSYYDALVDTGVQAGRVTLLLAIIEWLIEQNYSVVLFGIGFGAITPSEWLGSASDPLFNLIGMRGAISGFGLTLIETGIFGAFTVLLFFIRLFLISISMARSTGNMHAKRWYKTVIVLLCVFLYDFLFYSTVLLRVLPLPTILFAVAASVVLVKKSLKKHRI